MTRSSAAGALYWRYARLPAHGPSRDRAGRWAVIVQGAHVVTVTGAEIPDGYVVVEGNRITAVGAGPVERGGHEVVDGRGCLLTPGFVNTHDHLYQWVTRGLAVDATLFEWLTTLYPVWAGIVVTVDTEAVARECVAVHRSLTAKAG